CGFAKPFRYTTPGGPSPCPGDDPGACGYYAASALPSAHGHFHVLPREVKRHGSSPVPTQELKATRSDLLYAGRIVDNASQRSDLGGPPPSHFGSGVSQPPFTPRLSRRFKQRFLAFA